MTSFSRRSILIAMSAAAAGGLASGRASAQTDPLPSWNDTGPKKAIMDFVTRITTQGSPGFRPARRTHRHFRQ